MRLQVCCVIGVALLFCTTVEALAASKKRMLIESARITCAKENALYELRNAHGIDKRAEEFETIEAVIFEEVPHRANTINQKSRLLNRIDFLMRNQNVNATLKDIIDFSNSDEGVDSLSCPYRVPVRCDKSKYRSVDGSCNNLERPLRGASFTPFFRELAPEYEPSADQSDIDDHPRCTGKLGGLPGARQISRVVHQGEPVSSASTSLSVFFTFWGQFLAHEVSDRALATGFNEAKVDCCTQTVPSPRSECFNIDIPSDDPFRAAGRTCLSFLRSMEVAPLGCRKGRREQLNLASSYIDGGAVYGNKKEKAEYLRKYSGGELITSEPNELPMKPHSNPLAEKMGFAFAQAGDPRAPEIALLTGVHTAWMREHNRIARELAVLNRAWDDEKLYQESRRVVVAMIQQITYNEWLPLLLGPALVRDHDLLPYMNQYYTGYNSQVDASTSNVVSTAAFRFGHSVITGTFPLCNKDYTESSTPAVTLSSLFFRSNQYLIHEQGLMRGMLARPIAPMDSSIVSDLTNKLFKTHSGNGGDLVALNIQRGRDHGLPSYNSWRKFYKLSPSASFTSGPGGFEDIPEAAVKALAKVYRHPDDVDVWTGGVSEKPVSGGLLGPLFANMLARQFSRYKQGDRFWYETRDQPQAFTLYQLEEIRKVSFARVICNGFDIDTIQPQVFKMATASGNQRIRCSDLKQLDLTSWWE